MRSINFFSLLLILSAIMFLPFTTKAQVTIGGYSTPHEFSILELIVSDPENRPQGFRLPQMNAGQRDTLGLHLDGLTGTDSVAAMGLQIFNTTNQCVETWNGERWISFCRSDRPEPPVTLPPHFNPDCVADPDCDPLIDFVATRLNDGTPRPFTHPDLPDFNMMPVTGGVFYMGVQRDYPNLPNFDAGAFDGYYPFIDLFPEAEEQLADFFAVHLVGLSSFYIGETLVTADLFRTVMTQAFPEFDLDALHNNWSWHGVGLFPINGANWYEAIVFMNRLSVLLGRTPVYSCGVGVLDLLNPATIPNNLNANWDAITKNRYVNGFRLPTNAEWEYAARGGQMNEYTRTRGASGTQFIFSGTNIDNLDDFAWHCGNANGMIHPVGLLLPNELGLYDMSGNVWEWVWDWASSHPACCAVNPLGPDAPAPAVLAVVGMPIRVNRGGSGVFCYLPQLPDLTDLVRVSNHGWVPPNTHSLHRGFRIASGSFEP